MTKLQVEEFPNLYRDSNTRAVINNNKEEYENYLRSRDQKLKELNRVEKLESDMSDLKNDLSEIKSLLRNIANGSWKHKNWKHQ